MRILVTRPHDDAEETATRLKAKGHESLIAPLLEIRYRSGGDLSLDGVQAILATSANGIRAFIRRTTRRDVPVFAVGQQSAEEARAAGFADVRSTEGGSTALATAGANWADPKKGALLHISGTDVAGDLAGALEQRGFTVRRETLYEAVMRTTLPDDVADALRAGTIDAVLLFSSRSAEAFVNGVKAASLDAACGNLLAIAISPAAAAPLSSLRFRDVRTPLRPNQEAMLALL